MEFKIWEILAYSVYVETCDSDANRNEIEERRLRLLLEEFRSLISNGRVYPCSYLFSFRNLFLDTNRQMIDV